MKKLILLVLFICFIMAMAGVEARADEWITRQITENEAVDFRPSLYDGSITWSGNADGDREIYYYDGTTGITTQITDNTVEDREASLYDGNIAWWSGSPFMPVDPDEDAEIYYYDGSTGTTTPITDNANRDLCPSLYDGNIAWQGDTGAGDYEIYYYDKTAGTTTQITDNTDSDKNPSLYDGNIAWEGDAGAGDYEIYYYDGTTGQTVPITDNTVDDYYPSLYDGDVAWLAPGTGGYEIYYYDGTTGITTQITDNGAVNDGPSLYDGNIAWYGNVDGDYEIYYYDGTTGQTTKITDNEATDTHPSLYDGGIAWCGEADGDNEIYYARLASGYIGDAIDFLGLTGYTEADLDALATLYGDQTSGTVNGMDWSYMAGNLPGDTGGTVYDIGDSWALNDMYYIKLGSGLAGENGSPIYPNPVSYGSGDDPLVESLSIVDGKPTLTSIPESGRIQDRMSQVDPATDTLQLDKAEVFLSHIPNEAGIGMAAEFTILARNELTAFLTGNGQTLDQIITFSISESGKGHVALKWQKNPPPGFYDFAWLDGTNILALWMLYKPLLDPEWYEYRLEMPNYSAIFGNVPNFNTDLTTVVKDIRGFPVAMDIPEPISLLLLGLTSLGMAVKRLKK